MQRRFTLKALTAAVALASISAVPAFAADTIKVGALYSQTGGLSIVEKMLELPLPFLYCIRGACVLYPFFWL